MHPKTSPRLTRPAQTATRPAQTATRLALTATLLLLLPATTSLPATTPPPAPPAGFTTLFNGRDLAGWWGAKTEDPRAYKTLPPEEFAKKRAASLADIHAHWRVENGELVNDGRGLYLTTDNDYGDIELRLEYQAHPLGDSGVYLRGTPQVQIWDYTNPKEFKNGAAKGSGALWNNNSQGDRTPGKYPLTLADKPLGEWNTLRILMAGARVWVWLNGKQTVDGAIMENYYDRKLPPPRSHHPPARRRRPLRLHPPLQRQKPRRLDRRHRRRRSARRHPALAPQKKRHPPHQRRIHRLRRPPRI